MIAHARSGPFLRDAWRLTRPYYVSEEKWSARGLLLTIILLNLSLVGMSVVLSFWNREFYNSLQNKDWESFIALLFWYRRTEMRLHARLLRGRGRLHRGGGVSHVSEPVAANRWRRWLTGRFLNEWLADRAYYRISLTTDRPAVGTDNPDQRIQEDLRDFVDSYPRSVSASCRTSFPCSASSAFSGGYRDR